jgi:hypothetical protein
MTGAIRTILFCTLVAGASGCGLDAFASGLAGAYIPGAQARDFDQGTSFETAGGGLQGISIEAYEPSLVMVTADDVEAMGASLNGINVNTAIAFDGREGGIAINMYPGDQLELAMESDRAIRGVVLAGPAGETAIEREAGAGACGEDCSGRVTSLIAAWISRMTVWGLTCPQIEGYLESRGMFCPDKPWYVPNPACSWQAATCASAVGG